MTQIYSQKTELSSCLSTAFQVSKPLKHKSVYICTTSWHFIYVFIHSVSPPVLPILDVGREIFGTKYVMEKKNQTLGEIG